MQKFVAIVVNAMNYKESASCQCETRGVIREFSKVIYPANGEN